jgi:hypothetical protein
METVQLKKINVYYCKNCGQRHREDELEKDKNGALICPTEHTRVSSKPVGEVIVEISTNGGEPNGI